MFKICFLFLITGFLAYAGYYTTVRDASVTNIPTAYTAAGSSIMGPIKANNLCCMNHSGASVALCFSKNAAADCISDDWHMYDSDSFCFTDHALGNVVFSKADSSITSGTFTCRAWRN